MVKHNISLNMIVKNSASELPRAIGSFKNILTEIIVIDTGSTDNTVAVAKELGAKVHHFNWVDSYSAARNYAIECSSCPWVMWLDDDEWIEPDSAEKFLALELDLSKYYFFNRRMVKPDNTREISTNSVRLFPKRPDVRWRYRIHEDILKSLQLAELTPEITDITIRNEGAAIVCDIPKSLYYKKNMEADLSETPEDSYILFQYALECKDLKMYDLAEEAFRKCILHAKGEQAYLSEAIGQYAHLLLDKGDLVRALKVLEPGRALYPYHPRLIDIEAIIERFMGNPDRAEQLWFELLAICDTEEINWQILNPLGVRIAAHNRLADLYESQGKIDQAKEQWKQALSIHPGYEPGLEGLKRLNRTG